MTNQRNAAKYGARHAFVYEKAKGLVELLAPKAGERILDLGCRTGALTAEIGGWPGVGEFISAGWRALFADH
jgi:hypothetical protein